jgi:hypothetical protein
VGWAAPATRIFNRKNIQEPSLFTVSPKRSLKSAAAGRRKISRNRRLAGPQGPAQRDRERDLERELGKLSRAHRASRHSYRKYCSTLSGVGKDNGRFSRTRSRANRQQDYPRRQFNVQPLSASLPIVLSDPPFTKLDIVRCRNLLIYLNAQTQNTGRRSSCNRQRLLGLVQTVERRVPLDYRLPFLVSGPTSGRVANC